MSTTTLQLVPWPPEPARAAVLLVAAVVCLWVLLSRRRAAGGSKNKERAARLPPGSFGWPLVGETLDFVSCAYSSRPEAFVDKRRLL
jgi:steroid 3-oxidase